MLKLIITLSAVLSFLIPVLALADAQPANIVSQNDIEKAVADILNRNGGKIKSIKPALVKGLYEILIEKDNRSVVIYIDEDRKYVMQGIFRDINTLKPVFAHPQELLQPEPPTVLDTTKIPVDYAFLIGNPKGTKKLYVFTDPDCPYCHKMHEELKKLEKLDSDVAIYIMLFPLPMHPGAYDKARVILETKDHGVLDNAFDGKEIPKPTRESSKAAIDAVIKFATENGIGGTPTVVLGDGKIVVGMKDAESLKGMINAK